MLRQHQQHDIMHIYSSVYLCLEPSGFSIVNIAPEANTFLDEVAFNRINKIAIAMAIGNEQRIDLESPVDPQIMDSIIYICDFFVSQVGIVEFGVFNLPIT